MVDLLVCAIHLPDRNIAVVVAPDEIGLAVAVEVVGTEKMPVVCPFGRRPDRPASGAPFICQIATSPSS